MLEEIRKLYGKYIGRKVQLLSKKNFDSGLKENTVKSIIKHPTLKERYAFSFVEDETIIEISECKLNNLNRK